MPEIVSFSLATVDLLCEHLAVERLPPPFEIPSVGSTDAERAELRREMWRDLRARGLAGDDHVLAPGIADRIMAMGRYESAISSLAIMADGRLMRALAAADSRCAVLAVQGIRNVHIAEVDPVELPLSIVDVLPPARPFPGRPVTVADGERAPMLDRARLRGGYFVARSRRDCGCTGTSTELTWVDTDVGRFSSRFVLDQTGRRYTKHTPVGRHELVAQLAELLVDAGHRGW